MVLLHIVDYYHTLLYLEFELMMDIEYMVHLNYMYYHQIQYIVNHHNHQYKYSNMYQNQNLINM